jgi:uncharacterized cupin superfamily protein
MKFFMFEDYINRENPEPGQIYRPEILTQEHGANDLGGMFGLLPPGRQVPYHYHVKRESVIIAISGEAIEIVEGQEYPFKAGQEYPFKAGSVCYIAAGEKHTTVNRSDRDFRYLEFFTCPPVSADFIEVRDK